MKGKIYYKTFKTPEACYVYDRRSNKILKITDEAYEELSNNGLDMKKRKRFQEKGYLLEDTLEKIEHPDTELLKCTFRINGAPFPRQRCKRLAPAVRYPFVVTC